MDIISLDKASLFPSHPLPNLSSVIWTERYSTPGDFEIRTFDTSMLNGYLNRGRLLTRMDGEDLMMIESSEVSYSKESAELIVKGRSLDAFITHRLIEGPYQKKFKMARTYTPAEVVAVIYWNSFCNTTTNDVLRATAWSHSPNDTIPEVRVTLSTTAGGRHRRWLEQGQADAMVQRFMEMGALGIRSLYPTLNTPDKKIVSVTTGATGRGNITLTSGIPPGPYFDIYKGVDRSDDQTARKNVVFNRSAGHISKGSFLFADQDYKSMIEIKSSVGDMDYGWHDLTSWNRRSLMLDAGSPDSGESATEFKEDLFEEYGVPAWNENQKKVIIDVEVSPAAPYVYGVDYFLGDHVSVAHGYHNDPNWLDTVRVEEIIRVQDAEGYKEYPTLTQTAK